MSLFGRLGLRARLVLALAFVAVVAVGLAALFSDLGLNSRLSESARARLQRSAGHFADVAAAVYADSGSWAAARPELTHLAELEDLRAGVRTNARVIRINGSLRGPHASAPVLVGGRHVATVTIAPANGQLLTPEEQQLHSSLNRLHVIAAGAAIAVALVIALLLAETLSRPLRRIRAVAERLERGDLDTRVEPGGAPELRSTARALNRLAETLEHEEELRKAGVADLAHELRTPVNGLLARIEAAQDGILPPAENLAAMHDEALRLTRLLDDLARLGDAEQPGFLLEKQPLDLAEVAAGAATSFAPQFADAGIEFSLHTEPAWVSGDGGRLEQIVDNLLSNALRYTEPGGAVTLSVRLADGEAALDVVDTGIGIPADDLRHIFTRFWRGDRSRSRATGGTGIGLAIVWELVRAHDGRIDVESAPGAGSRFHVTLPALGERRDS